MKREPKVAKKAKNRRDQKQTRAEIWKLGKPREFDKLQLPTLRGMSRKDIFKPSVERSMPDTYPR